MIEYGFTKFIFFVAIKADKLSLKKSRELEAEKLDVVDVSHLIGDL